ncbi:hypothetical protein AYI68_g5664, partial [Smittium mucronatum]
MFLSSAPFASKVLVLWRTCPPLISQSCKSASFTCFSNLHKQDNPIASVLYSIPSSNTSPTPIDHKHQARNSSYQQTNRPSFLPKERNDSSSRSNYGGFKRTGSTTRHSKPSNFSLVAPTPNKETIPFGSNRKNTKYRSTPTPPAVPKQEPADPALGPGQTKALSMGYQKLNPNKIARKKSGAVAGIDYEAKGWIKRKIELTEKLGGTPWSPKK